MIRKKNDAAIIIQRNWDICRWNPKYKIAIKYVKESYRQCMEAF